MQKLLFYLSILLAFAISIHPVPGLQADEPGREKPASAARIMEQLENRYGGKNFSARFKQESTLKAMDITDTASGKAWFKDPGMMRWEYKKPQSHVIITDGKTLWIYRPEDNQVVLGDATHYFGNGKGASFLADFGLLSQAFDVTLTESEQDRYRLKMLPRKKNLDLSVIYLIIEKQSLDIKQVVTENVYGDITRIYFNDLKFDPEMKDALFNFKIPPGADVVRMGQ